MKKRNPRVLLVCPLPPPVHGSSMVSNCIRESRLINGAFDVDCVNISTSRGMAEIGRFHFAKIWRFVGSYIIMLWKLLTHRYDLRVFSDYVYYAFGYSVFFLMGLKIKNMHIRDIILFLVVFSIAYIVYMYVSLGHIANGMDILTDINYGKYPPHLGYSIYGLWGGCITYWLVNIKHRTELPKIISFIGSNTIWIYLYHIPFVQIMWMTKLNWIIQYVFVIVMAVMVTYIQCSIVKKIQSKRDIKVLNYLKG